MIFFLILILVTFFNSIVMIQLSPFREGGGAQWGQIEFLMHVLYIS